jgi:alkylation response protein AidB-like acyl-CoA dehydrogenase
VSSGRSDNLNDDEEMLVATVRAFIDRDVKPTVREVEHANAYPEAWIEQMKRIGIYGLAIPEEYGGAQGHLDRARRTRARTGGVAGPAQAGL